LEFLLQHLDRSPSNYPLILLLDRLLEVIHRFTFINLDEQYASLLPNNSTEQLHHYFYYIFRVPCLLDVKRTLQILKKFHIQSGWCYPLTLVTVILENCVHIKRSIGIELIQNKGSGNSYSIILLTITLLCCKIKFVTPKLFIIFTHSIQ
jgi:hypothetical protein